VYLKFYRREIERTCAYCTCFRRGRFSVDALGVCRGEVLFISALLGEGEEFFILEVYRFSASSALVLCAQNCPIRKMVELVL